jgi:hypothetical protein
METLLDDTGGTMGMTSPNDASKCILHRKPAWIYAMTGSGTYQTPLAYSLNTVRWQTSRIKSHHRQ